MRWLVAVDLADRAQEVVEEAGRWAARAGAVLDVAYADAALPYVELVHDPGLQRMVAEEATRLHHARGERLRAITEHLPEAVRGAPRLLDGEPAPTLAAAAAGYDALLVATHGRTGLAHLWLGSVAERLVRTAPVPVLVLRLGPEGGA